MEMPITSSAASPRPMNVTERIIGVFTRPRAVFTELRERPSWLPPLVLVVLTALVAGALLMPVILSEQAQRISENANIPEERKAEILKGFEGPASTGRTAMAVAAALATTVLSTVVAAAVLLFGANFLLGGALRFRHAMALYATASLIGIPSALIKVPMILAKKSTQVSLGPAAFLSPEAADTIAGKALAGLDAFSLWQWALVVLGLAVMARTTIRRAATFAVPLWLFWRIVMLFLPQ